MKDKEQYERRLAVARAMNARPVQEDQPGQKFPRGVKVEIKSFYTGELTEAHIEYSYAQKFGGRGQACLQYAVIERTPNGELAGSAWHWEDNIKLLDKSTEEGLKIIAQYEQERG